jgi:hypothetical protein
VFLSTDSLRVAEDVRPFSEVIIIKVQVLKNLSVHEEMLAMPETSPVK